VGISRSGGLIGLVGEEEAKAMKKKKAIGPDAEL